jgi:hypothetical protein
MKVTHIYHSGFMVELEQKVLIFDWYTGKIKIPENKKKYYFVSHSHSDHYSDQIFRYDPNGDDCYILDTGIAVNKSVSDKHKILKVKPDMEYGVDDLTIQTLMSTDEGLAFLINTDNTTIYHAGDLNWWYWRGEPDSDNEWQEKTFKSQIDIIKGKHIDCAFLTLDPRQEEDACLGIKYFLNNTDTRAVFPMHYWSDKKQAMEYMKRTDMKKYTDIVFFDDTKTI